MLAGALYWVWYSTSGPDLLLTKAQMATTAASSKDDAPSPAVFEIATPTDYRDALPRLANRPLFSETRRIPVAEIEEIPEPVEPEVFEDVVEVEPPPEPPQDPALTFLGFVRNGDQTRALIQTQEASAEQWVDVGSTLSGWTVVEITESELRLQQDGFNYVVEINR